MNEFNQLHESLNNLIQNGSMTPEETEQKEVDYKRKQIKEVYNIDLNKIRTLKDGRASIHIGAKLQREIGKATDSLIARNEKELVTKLYTLLFPMEEPCLNDRYEEYHSWRFDIGTKSKTLKEEGYLWNCFFRDTLGKIKVSQIRVSDIRDQFLKMTANNAITRTRFNDAKCVLNGVFRYCVEQEIIPNNPVEKICYSQFAKRFKPIVPVPDYTREEVETIVRFLSNSTDVYDCAICFGFNACMRFGELRSLKYEDINGDMITIQRSASDVMPAYRDENGNVAFGKTETVETYVKGATSDGIRNFPLTARAKSILESMHAAHPNWEYIFMSNGTPLKNVTFGRHLKHACESNGIEYRPCKIIRFTNCDALLNEANVSKPSLQSYMGHSTDSMTDHYIARHKSKACDNEKARTYLEIN